MINFTCSILAIIPLSALFILFDFVVHHPHDPDIRAHLTLLDIITGHFSQLDYASNGALKSSHLSAFSHMARQYVESVAGSKRPVEASAHPASSATQAQIPGDYLAASVYGSPQNDHLVFSNDPTPVQGSGDEYGSFSLDSLYFLTPDSDWMTGMAPLDEFDPRDHYGSIFL